MAVRISNDDRVLIVGTTGSGKTFLARRLLIGRGWVVVVDPKHEFSWDLGADYDDIYENVDDLMRDWRGPAPAIYRPTIGELQTELLRFWSWAWELRRLTVYVDEVNEITPESRPAYGLRRALKMGRSRGLSVWMATQRPYRVPLAIVSEATHYFVGLLKMPQDRKRMAEVTGQPIITSAPIVERRFYYVNSKRPADAPAIVNAAHLTVRIVGGAREGVKRG